MMIMMAPEASPEQIRQVVARLEATGTVHPKVVPGESQIAVAAIGDAAAVRGLGLQALDGVDQVVPLSRPYKLASSELSRHAPSVFDIAGRRIGPDTFCIIAGPCTVESREQTLRVAAAVAPHAAMLRGGAFKPRTSPFSFKGLGRPALEILAEARERTGLPVVTELTDLQQAEAVAEVADVIQIGARNMQNYALLEVAGKLGKPVLLKRGLSSTLEELLMAADYVLKEGTDEVVLCEFEGAEDTVRLVAERAAIPFDRIVETRRLQ